MPRMFRRRIRYSSRFADCIRLSAHPHPRSRRRKTNCSTTRDCMVLESTSLRFTPPLVTTAWANPAVPSAVRRKSLRRTDQLFPLRSCDYVYFFARINARQRYYCRYHFLRQKFRQIVHKIFFSVVRKISLKSCVELFDAQGRLQIDRNCQLRLSPRVPQSFC